MKKFVCGVTFQYEIGYTDEIQFYDSIEELKEDNQNFKCYEQCGIVELEFEGPSNPQTLEEITSYRWILEQDMGWEKVNSNPTDSIESDQSTQKKVDKDL